MQFISKFLFIVFLLISFGGNQSHAQYLSNAYGDQMDNSFTVTKEAYGSYFTVGITGMKSTFSKIDPATGDAVFTLHFADNLMVKNFVPIGGGDMILVGRSQYEPYNLPSGGINAIDLGIMLWRVRSDGSIAWVKEYKTINNRPLQLMDHMMDLPIYDVGGTIAIPAMVQDSNGGNTADPVILFADYNGGIINTQTLSYDTQGDVAERIYDVVYEPGLDAFVLLGEFKDGANQWHNTINVVNRSGAVMTQAQFPKYQSGKEITFKRITPVYNGGSLDGYVVVGFYGDRNTHFITKFNAALGQAWMTTVPATVSGVNFSNIRNLLQDSDGNIQVVGFHRNASGSNTYALRLDLGGGLLSALQSDPITDYYQPIITNAPGGKLFISGAVRNRPFIQGSQWDAYLLVADNDWAVHTSTGTYLHCSMKQLNISLSYLNPFATEAPAPITYVTTEFGVQNVSPRVVPICLTKNPTCGCSGI